MAIVLDKVHAFDVEVEAFACDALEVGCKGYVAQVEVVDVYLAVLAWGYVAFVPSDVDTA